MVVFKMLTWGWDGWREAEINGTGEDKLAYGCLLRPVRRSAGKVLVTESDDDLTLSPGARIRKDLSPSSCLLISICVLWYVTHIHTHVH